MYPRYRFVWLSFLRLNLKLLQQGNRKEIQIAHDRIRELENEIHTYREEATEVKSNLVNAQAQVSNFVDRKHRE